MAKNDNLKDLLIDIANAIREKREMTGEIPALYYPEEILAIGTDELVEYSGKEFTDLPSYFTEIAEAIRFKKDITEDINVQDFHDEIMSIEISSGPQIIMVRGLGSPGGDVDVTTSVNTDIRSIVDGEYTIYENDMDDIFPFKDIREYTDSSGNVMIEIPRIYFKFYESSGNITGFDISDIKINDDYELFKIQEGGKTSVGKYIARTTSHPSYTIDSKSGVDFSDYHTMSSTRNNARRISKEYGIIDWQIWGILRLLMTTYFGTVDLKKYFEGTDSVTKRNGKMNGYKTAMWTGSNPNYRLNTFFGIENIIGNGTFFLDGVYKNKTTFKFAENPLYYTSQFTSSSSYRISVDTQITQSTTNYVGSYTSGKTSIPRISGSEGSGFYTDFYTITSVHNNCIPEVTYGTNSSRGNLWNYNARWSDTTKQYRWTRLIRFNYD